MQVRIMSFLRGFSIAMGANGILFVLSFCTNKLLYLYLGLEDNGLYFLIMRLSLFFSLIVGNGSGLPISTSQARINP